MPLHEFVQTAHFVVYIVAGTNVQVVGIAEFYLTFELVGKVYRGNAALYRGSRAHVHENRRLYSAVNGGKLTSSGVSLLFYQFKHIKQISP